MKCTKMTNDADLKAFRSNAEEFKQLKKIIIVFSFSNVTTTYVRAKKNKPQLGKDHSKVRLPKKPRVSLLYV